jgi:hypothetical protein
MAKKKIMPKMFAKPDLLTMHRVRCAFDPLQLSEFHKKLSDATPHPLESSGSRSVSNADGWTP